MKINTWKDLTSGGRRDTIATVRVAKKSLKFTTLRRTTKY